MRVSVNGEWRDVAVMGIGDGDQLLPVTIFGDGPFVLPDVSPVTFTVTGPTTFEPFIEATGEIEWYEHDLVVGAGPQPSIDLDSGSHQIAMRVRAHAGGLSAMASVTTVNLGFNHTEDAGQYNIGPDYDWPTQSVTAVEGLGVLTEMERFCAAHCPIEGRLDFTGCVALEYIECFQADVQAVTLTGCDSLIRLCLENCRVAGVPNTVDLNPVRTTLRDLRGADQRGVVVGSVLTFATLAGPLENVYHFCLRDQPLGNAPGLGSLPAVEEYWCWDTGQTVAETPISPVARSFPLYDNDFDQASVDRILVGLRDHSLAGAYSMVDLRGSAPPSSAGVAAAATLTSRGWTVSHS